MESLARTVCDKSLPAEQMAHHNDVPAGGQMMNRRYDSEFIPRPRHRARCV
jgi:hypothetical protein